MPLAAAGAAEAQQAAGGSGRAYEIVPSATVTEMLTDNVGLNASKQVDSITQASASIHAISNAGRLRGSLDYTLSTNIYARSSGRNDLQNALRAAGSGEVIENRLFVDVSASISQQAISAFGTQSADSELSNSNRTEVRSLTVSPYLKGQFAPLLSYEVRLSGSRSDSDTSVASDVTTTSGSVRLGAGNEQTVISANVDMTRQTTSYSLGRRSEDDSVRGTVNYAATPELVLSAIGGSESNDYVSLQKTRHSIVGAQAKWTPSTRTRASARYERRYFGNSHLIDVGYRTSRTSWTFTDTRDVQTSQLTASAQPTQYDVLFAQYASQIPDPVARDAFVRQLLGLPPSSAPINGFIASGAILQQSRAVSAALQGLRQTVVVRYVRSRSERLDATATGVTDDFAGTGVIKQQGITVDVSHRLSPASSFSVSGNWQQTNGNEETPKSVLRSLTATYAIRLTQRIDAFASARHARFTGGSSPYVENMVMGTIRLQF